MKLFVARLDYGISSEDLQREFEEYGDVQSCTVIMDRETGRSKGFGFVEMDDESARNAMAELDGAEIRGREIVVKKAEDNRR